LKAERAGAVLMKRPKLLVRLNGWRKRSPLNPYWIDWLHLRNSVAKLAPRATGLLLDVGVAQRPYAALFEPYVERYIGLDYPPALIAKQPELWNVLDLARGLVDLFADGNQMPFADGTFDTVFCTEVLEHLPDPARCVSEMARVLKPGGQLLLTVPFSQPLHELPWDFYRFTPGALEDLLRRGGLEVEIIEQRGNFAAALGAMSSQFFLRTLGASARQSDGSVILSRWRSVLLLPFLACVQLFFHAASKLSKDPALALGYSAVGRKP